MTNRDHRYSLVKPMLDAGKIEVFNDIFKYIPKTKVATDLGKKVDRFNELMNNVEGFNLKDLFLIAKFCEMTEKEILDLTLKQYLDNKNRLLHL
jgi:hypothetical protein